MRNCWQKLLGCSWSAHPKSSQALNERSFHKTPGAWKPALIASGDISSVCTRNALRKSRCSSRSKDASMIASAFATCSRNWKRKWNGSSRSSPSTDLRLATPNECRVITISRTPFTLESTRPPYGIRKHPGSRERNQRQHLRKAGLEILNQISSPPDVQQR